MDMSLSGLRELVMDREAGRAAIPGHDWATELNWTESSVIDRQVKISIPAFQKVQAINSTIY